MRSSVGFAFSPADRQGDQRRLSLHARRTRPRWSTSRSTRSCFRRSGRSRSGSTASRRVNYDLAGHRLVDGLVGFQYDADCWQFGFGMQRYANGVTTTGQSASGTRVLAQLTFKGLSNVDNGLVTAFRSSVQGYQTPPPAAAAARAFHQLRVTACRRPRSDAAARKSAGQAAHERARPVFDGVSVAIMNMFRSTTLAAGAFAAALFLSSPAGAGAGAGRAAARKSPIRSSRSSTATSSRNANSTTASGSSRAACNSRTRRCRPTDAVAAPGARPDGARAHPVAEGEGRRHQHRRRHREPHARAARAAEPDDARRVPRAHRGARRALVHVHPRRAHRTHALEVCARRKWTARSRCRTRKSRTTSRASAARTPGQSSDLHLQHIMFKVPRTHRRPISPRSRRRPKPC